MQIQGSKMSGDVQNQAKKAMIILLRKYLMQFVKESNEYWLAPSISDLFLESFCMKFTIYRLKKKRIMKTL